MDDIWKDRIIFGLLAMLIGGEGLKTKFIDLPQKEAVVDAHKVARQTEKTTESIESIQEIKWIDIIERLDRIEEEVKKK